MDKNRKILLVDDSNTFILYLKDLLKDEPHLEIKSINDPKNALEIARQWKPDLLLTDFEMPDIGGPELCRLFRNDDQLKDIFIIMLTSKVGDMHLIEAINNGADDYICKSSHKAVVLIKIQSMIRQVEMAKALIHKKQIEAISMLIVTAKHNLNNCLTKSNGTIRNVQKKNISLDVGLETLKNLNDEISGILTRLDSIDRLEIESYVGNTKMIKID